MKIRTLDSMEEIDTAANGIEGSDREQRYQDPSGVEGRNVSETSNGGNNTAVTFGVPVVVDKTVGKTGETVPESKQQNGSRSETLDVSLSNAILITQVFSVYDHAVCH